MILTGPAFAETPSPTVIVTVTVSVCDSLSCTDRV
jgi:hypothetical protein